MLIENNYPLLCSGNTHFIRQLKRVQQYNMFNIFTEATNQPELLRKFHIHSAVGIQVNPNRYVSMSCTLVRHSVRMPDH